MFYWLVLCTLKTTVLIIFTISQGKYPGRPFHQYGFEVFKNVSGSFWSLDM